MSITVRPTLTHPAAWLGLVGALVVAAGELRRAGTSVWTGRPDALSVVATGIAVLALAWLLARPMAGRTPPSLIALVALWSVPLLALPPMLSTDAGSYADLGWIVLHGQSPYDVGLGTSGSPFAYGRAWRGTTSVYPALSLRLFGWIVQVSGADAVWSVVALRVLAIAGVAGLAWALPRLARATGTEPEFATWAGIANPLVIVHGVGGEHIDLLMAGVAAVALALATRRHGLWWGAAVLGVAAAIKQPALLAIPAVAGLAVPWPRRSWWRFAGGCVLVAVVAVGVFVGISAWTGLGLGWIGGTGNPANSAQTLTPAYLVATLAGLDVATLTRWGVAAAAIIVVVLAVRDGHRHPLRFLSLAALTWALGFGTLHEWYLLFAVAFWGLARPGLTLTWAWSLLAPFWAVYGCWREYARASVLVAGGNALIVAVGVAGVAWALTRAPGWIASRPAALRRSAAT